ncbi:carbohydrate kinase [Halobacteriales archaeon QS_4_62_28]|nr:MAG: carbohydrate kinase [Halobacteriales archaeon QS_4_62_28]
MKENILVMGENFVDFLPEEPGSIEDIATFSRRAGGSAVNVTIGLANLGEHPLLRTRIGQDPFGQFLLATLADHGISREYIEQDETARTSLSFVGKENNTKSALSFTFYRHETADTQMEANVIPNEVLANIDWVHTTSVGLESEPTRTALLKLMERAQAMDCQVSFFPNTRGQLWSDPDVLKNDFDTAIGLSDVITGTIPELVAAGYEGTELHTLSRELCELGPNAVFLSVNDVEAYGYVCNGALEGEYHHDGFEVTPKYPIGSTDAFTAAIIASYMNDVDSLEEMLKSASAVASISTLSPGAITMFSLKQSASSLYRDLPWSD